MDNLHPNYQLKAELKKYRVTTFQSRFPKHLEPFICFKGLCLANDVREMFELKVYNKMEPGALKWLL